MMKSSFDRTDKNEHMKNDAERLHTGILCCNALQGEGGAPGRGQGRGLSCTSPGLPGLTKKKVIGGKTQGLSSRIVYVFVHPCQEG